MIYFEKSQPAPECLELEKQKKTGKYNCSDVLDRLERDFKNKCYLCEQKGITNINIEHFKAHQGDVDLKFDWNNLFFACGHCNNTKLDKYDNILNCCKVLDNVEERLEYFINPFPKEEVEITSRDNDEKVENTKHLLLAIYNGTTKLKKLEAHNLRERVREEVSNFRTMLENYDNEANNADDKIYFLNKIKNHLNSASAFISFKRWLIRKDEGLLAEFGAYFE